jgi:hypothetical protein
MRNVAPKSAAGPGAAPRRAEAPGGDHQAPDDGAAGAEPARDKRAGDGEGRQQQGRQGGQRAHGGLPQIHSLADGRRQRRRGQNGHAEIEAGQPEEDEGAFVVGEEAEKRGIGLHGVVLPPNGVRGWWMLVELAAGCGDCRDLV